MIDVDTAIAEALARIMQRVEERLQHTPKPVTFYRRSVGQLYRRKLERERQQGEVK